MLIKKELEKSTCDISGPRGNVLSIVGYLGNFIGKEEARALLKDKSYNYQKIVALLVYYCDICDVDIIHDFSEEMLEEINGCVEERKQKDLLAQKANAEFQKLSISI